MALRVSSTCQWLANGAPYLMVVFDELGLDHHLLVPLTEADLLLNRDTHNVGLVVTFTTDDRDRLFLLSLVSFAAHLDECIGESAEGVSMGWFLKRRTGPAWIQDRPK